jgi:hypothetical protein
MDVGAGSGNPTTVARGSNAAVRFAATAAPGGTEPPPVTLRAEATATCGGTPAAATVAPATFGLGAPFTVTYAVPAGMAAPNCTVEARVYDAGSTLLGSASYAFALVDAPPSGGSGGGGVTATYTVKSFNCLTPGSSDCKTNVDVTLSPTGGPGRRRLSASTGVSITIDWRDGSPKWERALGAAETLPVTWTADHTYTKVGWFTPVVTLTQVRARARARAATGARRAGGPRAAPLPDWDAPRRAMPPNPPPSPTPTPRPNPQPQGGVITDISKDGAAPTVYNEPSSKSKVALSGKMEVKGWGVKGQGRSGRKGLLALSRPEVVVVGSRGEGVRRLGATTLQAPSITTPPPNPPSPHAEPRGRHQVAAQRQGHRQRW